MSKQFCFKINNPKKVKFDSDELKSFVKSLYIGEDKFTKDDNLPFLQIYDKIENDVCIWMVSKGKKNIELITKINDSFTPQMLKWKNNITLSNHGFIQKLTLLKI